PWRPPGNPEDWRGLLVSACRNIRRASPMRRRNSGLSGQCFVSWRRVIRLRLGGSGFPVGFGLLVLCQLLLPFRSFLRWAGGFVEFHDTLKSFLQMPFVA